MEFANFHIRRSATSKTTPRFAQNLGFKNRSLGFSCTDFGFTAGQAVSPADCLNKLENGASPLMDIASLLADKAIPPANEPHDFDSMSNC